MKHKWGGRFTFRASLKVLQPLLGDILCSAVHPERFHWFRCKSCNMPLNLHKMYFWYDLGATQLYTILSIHVDSQPILAQSPGFRFWPNYCSNILDTFMYNCHSERKCRTFACDVGRIWMSPTLGDMYLYGFGHIIKHFPDIVSRPWHEKLVHVKGSCGLGMLQWEPPVSSQNLLSSHTMSISNFTGNWSFTMERHGPTRLRITRKLLLAIGWCLPKPQLLHKNPQRSTDQASLLLWGRPRRRRLI